MSISAGLGAVLPPVGYGFRNVIFNGNFMVNQRGYTSGTNLASGSYGFDRWKSNYTNTTLTFTSAPQGQTVTISASGVIRQVVEQANVRAGSYVLSWTGTATGRVYNSGATAPSYASSPVSAYLDGTADVIVEFTPSSGTATLGDVQLEFGSRATPFEARPIGVELALCQRYYENSGYPKYSIPTAVTGQGAYIAASNAYRLCADVYFKVTKRDVPTVTIYNTNDLASGSTSEFLAGTGFITNRTSTVLYPSTTKFGVESSAQFATGREYNFSWKAEIEL